MVKKVAIVLGALVGALVVGGIMLPAEYGVERTGLVKASPAVIYAQIIDVEKAQKWSPWKDETMKVTYGAIKSGVGASYSWTSEEMGSGTLTIKDAIVNQKIVNALDFGDEGVAEASWTMEKMPNGMTKVVWSMTGNAGNNLVRRYFGAMMDRMVGTYFENGIANLAKIAEAMPPQQPTAQLDPSKAEAAAPAAAGPEAPADAAPAAAAPAAPTATP